MKRKMVFVLAVVSVAALFLAACRGRSGSEAVPSFEPTRNIEGVCSSSPGGGSDMFIRAITGIMESRGFVNRTIVVVNQTDGGGRVAEVRVARATDDHLILAVNSGAVLSWLNTGVLTVEDVTPLAVMALDKQLLVIGRDSPHKTFPEFVAAVKAGNRVVMGGSRGDDSYAHKILIDELVAKERIDPALVPYVPFNSTSEAITAMLGGHLDIAVVKPAAAMQFVLAGELTPVMVYGDTRLPAPYDVPTITEFGYDNIEFHIWRAIVGPKNMTPGAIQFWSDALEATFNTDEWKDYLDRNILVPFFVNARDSVRFFKESEDQIKTFL